MNRVITAPEPLPTQFENPAVFLAGSIDDGTAVHWQKQFLVALQSEDLTLLNPRRDQWRSTVVQAANVPEFREQVDWELTGLERADLIALHFAPESRAPISLLELGLFARTGKLIVSCPEGYWRKGNVEMVCQRYGVALVGSLDELIQTVRNRLANHRENKRGQTLFAGKFLALIKEGHWEYAHRTNATGAAIIAAVTDEKKILLVEQYRIPVHARTIELPAGIIGDEPGSSDESHAEAARRELVEETGYEAGQIEALTHGPASAGLGSEVLTLFLASKLRRVGAGGGVAHEDITVHEVALSEIDSWLEAKAKAGVLIDPKVYAGLYFISKNK
ncbi:MAG: nucleoside 2-deoxyribosyltransferase domain-containing protein [Verrucomicrobiota bacterium]